MPLVKQSGPSTGGHFVERGTPAYWITTALDGSDEYVPVRVDRVEEADDGRMLATFTRRVGGVGFQSRAQVGPVIVARKATGIRGGRRVTLRPSFGLDDDALAAHRAALATQD